jgi:hypothetical protein
VNEAIMSVRRYVGFLTLLLMTVALAACAGGSGSSGFDTFPRSEDAAIQQALAERRCVPRGKLTICPADETLPTPTASPTPTPTPPGAGASPTPVNPEQTPAGAATPTPAARPSATATSAATPGAIQVDTGLDPRMPVPCVAGGTSGCIFIVPFAPQGFPEPAEFRVAVRTTHPKSLWTIGPALSRDGTSQLPVFDAPVAMPEIDPTRGPVTVQIAVLVFETPPASVLPPVNELAATGASFAFVSSELVLQPEPLSSP